MFAARIITSTGKKIRHTHYFSFVHSLRSFAFGKVDQNILVQLNIHGVLTPFIRIRTSNLYITGLRSPPNPIRDLSSVRYAAENPLMNLASLQQACFNAFRWADLDPTYPHLSDRDLKLLTFIISEAARFQLVKKASLALLNNISLPDWNTWSLLLRNWHNLSQYPESLIVGDQRLPIKTQELFLLSRGTLFSHFRPIAKAIHSNPDYDSDIVSETSSDTSSIHSDSEDIPEPRRASYR